MRYCPTDIMWADVLTKPLQGQKFRDMRAFLQNCPRDYNDDIELQNNPLARQTMNHQVKTNVSLRECVGEYSKVKTAKNVPVHFSKLPQWQPQIPAKSVVDGQAKLRAKPAKNVPVHFSKLPQQQPQIPAKSVVDGQAKLRAKQRTKEPSQPRGHPQATSPTCVSRVTWGPSQVVLIADRSKGSHRGPTRDPTKGCPRNPTKNQQRIGDDPQQFRK